MSARSNRAARVWFRLKDSWWGSLVHTTQDDHEVSPALVSSLYGFLQAAIRDARGVSQRRELASIVEKVRSLLFADARDSILELVLAKDSLILVATGFCPRVDNSNHAK